MSWFSPQPLSEETVTVRKQNRWSILTPGSHPPHQNIQIFTAILTQSQLHMYLKELGNGLLALDIETKGNDPSLPESEVVGIGLSNNTYSIYLDLQSSYDGCLRDTCLYLSKNNNPLIAHNLFFDASFLLAQGHWLNWERCTYALYKLMATEGWPGQEWGLKSAQRDLLGWEETNEKELDQWLVDNGYGSAINEVDESKRSLVPGEVSNWNNWLLEHGHYTRKLRPTKGEMWRAPASILGRYCALDAQSTFLLYTKVLKPALERFPELDEYSGPLYINYIRILIEQKLSGISIDRDSMKSYAESLISSIEQAEKDFRSHPSVAPLLQEFNREVVELHSRKEPERYKKEKVRKEPKRKYRKDGKISGAWLSWKEWNDSVKPREETSRWIEHQKKLQQLKREDHFNLNSGPARQWLFYERMGHPVILKTEKGNPAVDERALKGFGEAGKLLIKYNELVKEESYVRAGLKHIRTGKEFSIHPSFRIPGTLTGRLAGSGGLNIQQVPKSKGYLSCWQARPGKVWVDLDFVSLEQVVLAELSKDPSLWKLYGPGAKENDVYLFNGAYLPIIGDSIRRAGYNPDSPTVPGIIEAKKHCKKERQISKIITLGSSYGMGPRKLRRTLALEGIDITEGKALEMWEGYWKLYGGVKEYEAELLRQYNNNGGWVLNGIGRPLGIDSHYTKDIVNRVVQSTGHDILVLMIGIVDARLKQEGVVYSPIIIDWHDSLTIEVDEKLGQKVFDMISKDCLKELNKVVGGIIPLKMSGGLVHNLAESKCG